MSESNDELILRMLRQWEKEDAIEAAYRSRFMWSCVFLLGIAFGLFLLGLILWRLLS